MKTSTTTQLSGVKILCPKHEVPLDYDFMASIASNYAGDSYHGLYCPIEGCDYKV